MKWTGFLLLNVSVLIFLGCSQPKKSTPLSKYSVRIYQTEIDQFGYDINADSVTIIHQPIIPGVSGNKGFATKEDAKNVADLVVSKLARGISPPSVSITELDSLKIKRP